jgi:hypothetical protein
VKSQWVRCKIGETIEQLCSDVLAHSSKVCKGAHLYNGYLASKDDHDSWGTCTTSIECKTVITVMLTVGLVLLARSILYSGLYGVIDVPLLRYWSFS